MEITLKWIGPFKFSELLTLNPKLDALKKPGVYIWTDSVDGPVKLTYVGKAEGNPHLLERQRQYFSRLIGGLSSIPLRFREGETDYVPMGGKSYNKAGLALITNEQTFCDQVVKKAFAYSKKCLVYCAPVDPESAPEGVPPKDLIKRIERNLLWDLKPIGTKWGAATEPKNPLTIHHTCGDSDLVALLKKSRQHGTGNITLY